jgi:hypothetical protein
MNKIWIIDNNLLYLNKRKIGLSMGPNAIPLLVVSVVDCVGDNIPPTAGIWMSEPRKEEKNNWIYKEY